MIPQHWWRTCWPDRPEVLRDIVERGMTKHRVHMYIGRGGQIQYIRAISGHKRGIVNPARMSCYVIITEEYFPYLVHGSDFGNLDSILDIGIYPGGMKAEGRAHTHFAVLNNVAPTEHFLEPPTQDHIDEIMTREQRVRGV